MSYTLAQREKLNNVVQRCTLLYRILQHGGPLRFVFGSPIAVSAHADDANGYADKLFVTTYDALVLANNASINEDEVFVVRGDANAYANDVKIDVDGVKIDANDVNVYTEAMSVLTHDAFVYTNGCSTCRVGHP